MGILMKTVRYNENPNENCAVQWESPPDHPSRPNKTYNQRRYRPARKSGKKHKKTYNSPPRRPAASRTKRTMHGAIVRPENPKKTYNSSTFAWLGCVVAVDNPQRGPLRRQMIFVTSNDICTSYFEPRPSPRRRRRLCRRRQRRASERPQRHSKQRHRWHSIFKE